MDDLYVSASISIIFFVIKLAMNKINKESEKNKNANRDAFKDSVYIFIISMLVLYLKKEYFTKTNIKMQVFTNEPGF
jgi:hypothetical protein